MSRHISGYMLIVNEDKDCILCPHCFELEIGVLEIDVEDAWMWETLYSDFFNLDQIYCDECGEPLAGDPRMPHPGIE